MSKNDELREEYWTLTRNTWLTPDSVMQIIFEVRLCPLSSGPTLGSSLMSTVLNPMSPLSRSLPEGYVPLQIVIQVHPKGISGP
ncbi:hypothetical protein GRJ2_003178700 [Grus japonensis]|uniref:Uncharacterized protein n=1 Tax=Grus japonensis TaxID=30415 RepID=A0ABC9YB21_GRUJA